MRQIERYLDELRVNPNGTYTADISELADVLDVSYAQAKRMLREECKRMGYRITDTTIDKSPTTAPRRVKKKDELRLEARMAALRKVLYGENSSD